jgi:hypothetical protein
MTIFVYDEAAVLFGLAILVSAIIVGTAMSMAVWLHQDLSERGEDVVSKRYGLGIGVSLIAGAVCWVGIIFSEHPFLDYPDMGIERIPLAFWLEIACFASLMVFFVLLRLHKAVKAGKTDFTTALSFAFVSAFALYADFDTWASRRSVLLMSVVLKTVSLIILYKSVFHDEKTPDENRSADIRWEE